LVRDVLNRIIRKREKGKRRCWGTGDGRSEGQKPCKHSTGLVAKRTEAAEHGSKER